MIDFKLSPSEKSLSFRNNSLYIKLRMVLCVIALCLELL